MCSHHDVDASDFFVDVVVDIVESVDALDDVEDSDELLFSEVLSVDELVDEVFALRSAEEAYPLSYQPPPFKWKLAREMIRSSVLLAPHSGHCSGAGS